MFASLAFSELTRRVLSPSTKILVVFPIGNGEIGDACVDRRQGAHAWRMRMLGKQALFFDGCSRTTKSIEDC